MMQAIFSFVILHYQNLTETMKCTENILKQNYPNRYVVIVDNDSDEGQIEQIQEHFQYTNCVRYIRTGKNYGYAKGNNIGIYYAKYILKADYVCVCNPDLTVADSRFIEKCIDSYNKDQCAVIGPNVMECGGGYKI